MKKLLCFFLFLAALMGCTSVPPGNVGIKVYLTGGSKGVDHEVLGVGRYWIGVNEQLFLYPTFQQNYVWTKSPHEGNSHDESITFGTKEGMEVNADVAVSYSLDPLKIPEIFQRYREGVEELTDKQLRNYVRDAFVAQASTMPVDEVYGPGKQKLLAEVQKTVTAEFSSQGIKIEKISIVGSFRLPESVQNALNAKIAATQNALMVENQVAAATAEARKKVAEAEGEAASMLAKAKAEAEANRLKDQSITEKLIRYETVRKWNGELPRVTSGNGTMFTMPLGDEKTK